MRIQNGEWTPMPSMEGYRFYLWSDKKHKWVYRFKRKKQEWAH